MAYAEGDGSVRDTTKEWPQLDVAVARESLSLMMAGPSQLVPSRVVDLKGNQLGREEAAKRLAKETPVLVSVSGDMPAPYFLQLAKADSLIIILGARDGSPAPGLLPARKNRDAPSRQGSRADPSQSNSP